MRCSNNAQFPPICRDIQLTAQRRPRQVSHGPLPPLLPRETFVEQGKNLWYIELDVFEVKFILIVFLHLEEVIEL